MNCSPPGSSINGILQARILEWIAISFFPEDLPDPGIKPGSPALQGRFFTILSHREVLRDRITLVQILLLRWDM